MQSPVSRDYREWFSNIRGDILAGIVVALALIPEAIGFSVIAGVDPKVGLYASFAIACVAAFVGGRPGMISAATAATAVLMVTLVNEHGLQYLFAATILMGADPDRRRVPQARPADEFRLALGHHRLRQRTRDPDLHGAVAGTDRRAGAHLCDDRRRARDHLPVPARHQGRSLAPRRHRRADDASRGGLGMDLRTVGDLGELPSTLPVLAFPQVPLHISRRCGSSCPIRSRSPRSDCWNCC